MSAMERRNVQLGEAERCQVYIEAETGRILGFGPEGAKPFLPAGVKVRSQTCYHAREIEKYAHQYRDQCYRDAEQSTLKALEREAPIRKALRDAIVERNRVVDQRNRDLNNALLKVMDFYYDKAKQTRMKREVTIAAERFEAGKLSTDLAEESVYLKGK